MKTNMLKIAGLVVGAAFFGAAQDSHAQIAAFQAANPAAVFGASRVPAETTGFFPSVVYNVRNQGGVLSHTLKLDVVGMRLDPIYTPLALGDGHIIGVMPAVSLPADVAPITVANRRPTTTKGPDWRFAIYTNVAQANAAIAAWANLARGAAVLVPTAAQDRKLQWVDTRALEWIDPAFDPLAPAAGSLVGFNYNAVKNPFFTLTYLTGKVIVIYGPARTNTAAKTTAPTQNIGYQTRAAYWVTPALR
jgi:hypothetical protein